MTDRSADEERLSLLGLPLQPGFERRVVALVAGDVHRVVGSDWRDAVVEVADGEITLELADGTSVRFASGSVLWLCGLPVRSLRNCGPGLAVLVALRRSHPNIRDESVDRCRLNRHEHDRQRDEHRN